MARAKRKVFDSGKQRATGSDITLDDVRNARREREKVERNSQWYINKSVFDIFSLCHFTTFRLVAHILGQKQVGKKSMRILWQQYLHLDKLIMH